MADIAPELYEKIKESFDRKYAQAQLFGGSMSEMFAKINNGTATFQDANIYASMAGGFMADAMKENLILDELPGKRLYSNIARKTIGEGLKDTYGIVSAAAKVAQAEHNAAAKIGLKPVQPKLETKRVDNIVNQAAAAKTQQELNNMLEAAVPTFARQVVDDTQKANARQHNKAGLAVKVEREYDGVGLHDGTDVCDWCLQRAGTWTYEKAMANGVFERHEGCGCIITYTSAKGEVTVSDSKYGGWNTINDPERLENNVLDSTYKKAYTKIDPRDIPPMDEKKFETIRRNLENMGVAVIQDADGDAYLRAMNAEAMTLSDGSAVIFQSSRIPSASAVFEEIIHVAQIQRSGMIESVNNDENTLEYLKREIEANEKLINYQKAYKLTPLDVKSIEENLAYYRKEISRFKNV